MFILRYDLLATLMLVFILLNSRAESQAYIMPVYGDQTIYKIVFDKKPYIEPLCVIPFYSSAVSGLSVSGDEQTVHLFFSKDMMILNRNENKHEIHSFNEINHWGHDIIVSPTGKYFLVECYRTEAPGKCYALIESHTGKMLRILHCDKVVTSACFGKDEKYAYFSCQHEIRKISIEEPNTAELTWLQIHANQPVVDNISCKDEVTLNVYQVFQDNDDHVFKTIQYLAKQNELGPEIRTIPGLFFNSVHAPDFEAFYCTDSGRATVINSVIGNETSFITELAKIRATLQHNGKEYTIAQEILKYPAKKPNIISFGDQTLTPDGNYCVFIMSSGARMNGLLIFYNLENKRWSALAVGNDDAGGITRLAFPPNN